MADSHCRSCSAPIVWQRTLAGKAMPLDPELVAVVPHPAGTVTGVDQDGALVRGDVATPDSPAAGIVQVRISHFATCPNAAQHRKERP